MILNPYTVSKIFIDGVSAILMVYLGITSLSTYKKYKRAKERVEIHEIENRTHLIFLIAVVIIIVRVINWPLFYITLHSMINYIEGAMCIFGVTQANPSLTRLMEFIKPFVFFSVGAWLILNHLDQKSPNSPFMGKRLLMLSIVAPLCLIDSIGDIVLISSIKSDNIVSCCTTVLDILSRPTRTIPYVLLGKEYMNNLNIIFWISTSLIISLLITAFKIRWEKRSRKKSLFSFLVFIFSIYYLLIFLLTQIEVHAPQIMGLPYHHCIYCLWQYVPDSIIIYLLIILGICLNGWAFILLSLGNTKETSQSVGRYPRKMYSLSIFFITISILMILIHLGID